MSLWNRFLKIHQNFKYRTISTSTCLFAEPLKKKKKVDPAIVKQREERRRKKLEKQIRRLEKNARQLKPVEELEIPTLLLDQKKNRGRQFSSYSLEILENRKLLCKDWTRFKYLNWINDFNTVKNLQNSQNIALKELRRESESLYQEAIQIDGTFLPNSFKGTVSTPALNNYISPDGDYIYIAKKWDK